LRDALTVYLSNQSQTCDGTDLKNVPRALVQQLHDAFVEFVDGLAVIGEAHVNVVWRQASRLPWSRRVSPGGIPRSNDLGSLICPR